MKIVWMMNECPLPANTGGKIGMFKRLEQVSKTNEIYLFYVCDSDAEIAASEGLKAYCKKVFAYKRRKGLGLLFSSLRLPYTIQSRNISRMQKDIADIVCTENPDLINVDFPQMCINLIGIVNKIRIPVVLNEHNIEWKFYRELADSGMRFPKRNIYAFDGRRLKKYEEKLVKKISFSGITFVSDKDMCYYKKWMGDVARMAHIPVGSDDRAITPVPDNKNRKKIIFVGLMSASPNEEGAEWFVLNVFPKILEVYPDAVFYAVGKNPGERVMRLAGDNVIVTGMVESVKEYYENADLVVIPLFHGGGVKVKLLEAVSFFRPVVSTASGVEGTAFAAGRHLYVADNADEFAVYCIKALSYDDETRDIVCASYNFFRQNYTWEEIGRRYCGFLREAALCAAEKVADGEGQV